jgi:hypothetical protein
MRILLVFRQEDMDWSPSLLGVSYLSVDDGPNYGREHWLEVGTIDCFTAGRRDRRKSRQRLLLSGRRHRPAKFKPAGIDRA